MKLTKTCAKFLRKHGGTILAVAASVGVVATAIETGRATTKAQHILEVDKELTKFNENEFGVTEEPPTKKQIVLMCWKAYVPAAILGGGTIACILGSNALNKKQIASLTAAYMALGKTYQEYRRQVAEQIGVEEEKDMEQLYIYAALFCLEYGYHPKDIRMELRIYQNDEVWVENPTEEEISPVIAKIKEFDPIITDILLGVAA